MKKILLLLSLLSNLIAYSQVIFSQGFDTFSTLAAAGWTTTNQSNPAGLSLWAQGGGTAFAGGGQAGGATSFTLCNFNSVDGSGTISNWLITPPITVKNGDVISFYTRKGGTSGNFPDRLEFRLSDQGAASTIPAGETGVGSFTNLAVSVNPNLTTNTTAVNGYPLTWTQYSYTVTGLAADTSMRMAFRYFVTDGGPDGANSNIIGVDTFAVTRTTLATNEVETKKSLSVYPTIADKELNVSLKNDQQITAISIYDMSGKAVQVVKSNVIDKSHSVIDVSALTSGNYIVNILTKDSKYTSKFIKK
ncbi:choice-of-anchor J domain-containing protein [Chryseobacterium sp. ISL-6]|uniref:T9SS-dependent choice-of-anchor J family protein n=1 Tax=Chryseobacterium sp. ISL-6 TaxID=2819143 RepID=UPI001BE7D56B|nr:choice-of-anchor J domain-containing protein [Chryseobacterium sp. ISL-6]MBT2620161.1 T9SS type A sorting domain-containing protein [Chryseobacterium sp. ISL-6]